MAPSPFNAVKLDLAVIIIIAVVLELGHDRIVSGLVEQLMLLGTYALLASLWLVWRTRRVLRNQRLAARADPKDPSGGP